MFIDLARDACADSFRYTSAEPSGGFFGDASPPSWPSFKYLKGEIVGNLTKTRTMALDNKGVIHSLGYKSDMHIKTDVRDDSIERSAQGYKGFIGNVISSDGYTYFLPAYSSSMGKLKRSTGEITLGKKFVSCPQVRSGAEGANGIIYMPSYTKTLKIYTLNTKTGQTGSFTPPQPGSWCVAPSSLSCSSHGRAARSMRTSSAGLCR